MEAYLRQGNSMVMTWVCSAHEWKGAGSEMDGGGSKQVSNADSPLISPIPLIICSWSGLSRKIHLSLVKSMCGNKMVQLLTAPKPSWTCSKEKESFCNCRRSLGLCIPLIVTSATFFFVGGSNCKFEGSNPLMTKTAVEDINTAILDKYICATAATIKNSARHFCLHMAAILSTLWHPCIDLELVSIVLIFEPYWKSDLISCSKNCCSCYEN